MRHPSVPAATLMSLLLLGTATTLVVLPRPVTAELASAQHVPWSAEVVEPGIVPNGHKPKALADVDGDGDLDVFAYYAGSGMFWYEHPTWTRHRMNGARGGEDARAVDVDGDRDVDIVVSGTRWFENPLSGGGDPRGAWAVHEVGGADSHDLLAGDVDGDGRPDLVVLGGTYLQAGSGWRFVSNAIYPDRGYKGSELADVDGDGDLDLIASTASTPYRLAWWANPLPAADPATTPWTKRVITEAWSVTAIGTGDMDGDGQRDIVMAPLKSAGGLWWLRAPADPTAPGTWERRLVDATVSFVHQTSLFAEDIDDDGSLDIVLAEQEQSERKRLAVYYNGVRDGDWATSVLADTGGHNPKVGDVDGDGDVDLLNANHGFYGADNPVVLWRNGLQWSDGTSAERRSDDEPEPDTSPHDDREPVAEHDPDTQHEPEHPARRRVPHAARAPSPTPSPTTSPPPSQWRSDDFDGAALDTAVWRTVDPVRDGKVTMTTTDGGDSGVSLSVPGGTSHDPWVPNRALRISRAGAVGGLRRRGGVPVRTDADLPDARSHARELDGPRAALRGAPRPRLAASPTPRP